MLTAEPEKTALSFDSDKCLGGYRNPHCHFSKLLYINGTDHPGNSLDNEVLGVRKVKSLLISIACLPVIRLESGNGF